MTKRASKVGTCKLCGKQAHLVRSHIIPLAFFDIEANDQTTLVSNSVGQYPRRSPKGVYDRIVCDACENNFGPSDQYAIKVLKQDLHTYKRIEHRGALIALDAGAINYRLLKLFAVSVLWRASVARHNFYARIQLGSLEDTAKAILLSGDPGNENEFASWWSFFDMSWTPGIMDPFQERWDNVNAYRFYFGTVLGYFKVDKQKIPEVFREIAIAPGRNLILVARNFERSKDLRAMRGLLHTAVGFKGFTKS